MQASALSTRVSLVPVGHLGIIAITSENKGRTPIRRFMYLLFFMIRFLKGIFHGFKNIFIIEWLLNFSHILLMFQIQILCKFCSLFNRCSLTVEHRSRVHKFSSFSIGFHYNFRLLIDSNRNMSWTVSMHYSPQVLVNLWSSYLVIALRTHRR